MAAAGRYQLRTSLEVQARRNHRLAHHRLGVRLPEVNVGADCAQPRGKVILQFRLLAGRVAGLPGGGVEGDQRAGQINQLLLAFADRVADPLFLNAQAHVGTLYDTPPAAATCSRSSRTLVMR